MRWLVGGIAAVAPAKIVVDGFPAPEAFVHSVPEADSILSEFPAEINLRAGEFGGEIDEAYVEILDDAAEILDLLHDAFQPRSGHFAAAAGFDRGGPTDADAACQNDAFLDGL